MAGLPAISLPAGFHATKPWPMGIQLIAGPQADAKLLAIAAAYELIRKDFIALRPGP